MTLVASIFAFSTKALPQLAEIWLSRSLVVAVVVAETTPVWQGSMKRRRLQVFYSGTVQGVGFRFQAKQIAEGFEVTGLIRNLPDGRVELVAEGDPVELEDFRTAIRESGVGPLIRNETELWSDSSGEFRGFVITQ